MGFKCDMRNFFQLKLRDSMGRGNMHYISFNLNLVQSHQITTRTLWWVDLRKLMQKLTAAVSFIWLINLILDIKIIFDVVQHFSFPHQIGHVLDRTHCHYSFNFVVDTAFPTLLTKSFHRLIERNAMHPHIFVHPLIKPFSFSSPLNNFIFDNLQLSANFAEKIFHLTLFPFPLFSFHELYISSPGENSETPFPQFFSFCQFSTSCFRSAQDGWEAVERCKGNCTGEMCSAVASRWIGHFRNKF